MKALNIDERARRREIRQKKRSRPNRSRLYDKPWWLRSNSFNVPDNIPRDLFGEVLEKVKTIQPQKAEICRLGALAVFLYSRLKKREPLIALGSHHGGP